MKMEVPGSLTKEQAKHLNGLFGPPPLLSSEDGAAYRDMRRRVFKVLRPQDFMERYFVEQLVIEMWKISRFNRHQVIGIERRYQQNLEFQEQRRSAQAAKKEAKTETAERSAEEVATFGPDFARLSNLDDKVTSVVEDVDRIFEWTRREIAHNEAFEQGIRFQTDLDRLIESAWKRIEKILAHVEHYRAGLGAYWRRVLNRFLYKAPGQIRDPYTPNDMINILSTPMQECFGYPARPVLDDSPDDRLAKPDVQVSADTQGSADPDTTVENSISAPHSAAAGDKSDVEVPPASNTSEGAPPANSNKTGGDGVA